MDIGIGLWAQFELIRTVNNGEESYADIKLLPGKSLNNLLESLLPHVSIHAVNEIIPDMEQIFIQAVQQFNASHE